jgi:hypothetical protein
MQPVEWAEEVRTVSAGTRKYAGESGVRPGTMATRGRHAPFIQRTGERRLAEYPLAAKAVHLQGQPVGGSLAPPVGAPGRPLWRPGQWWAGMPPVAAQHGPGGPSISSPPRGMA